MICQALHRFIDVNQWKTKSGKGAFDDMRRKIASYSDG